VSPADDQVHLTAASGETVLVVEDNPQLRRLSLRRLQLLGYRVLEAESGPAALTILEGKEIIFLSSATS
jgi:two-component system CheB/CheR fusion protein